MTWNNIVGNENQPRKMISIQVRYPSMVGRGAYPMTVIDLEAVAGAGVY